MSLHHPSAPTIAVEPMCASDAGQVLAVYQAGIDTGNATFETRAPSWDAFDADRLPDHRFVARDTAADRVLGWVAVSPVSRRAAYAGVLEHSVYVAPEARGHGVGALLLGTLIESTEGKGIRTLQSGVFPENAASLALHLRAGFRVIGIRERVGRLRGVWRDVVLIERRSRVVDWPSTPSGLPPAPR